MFCQCSHNKERHNDQGQCCANVKVVHEGKEFIKRCGCTKYREDKPRTLRDITPEELLTLPITTPYFM
jgi:hypothetical protein